MAWSTANFCVLPLKPASKAPAVSTWKQYVQPKGSNVVPAAPSPQIVDRWFTQPQHGLGLILGATSGNAEMFEFEGRATHLLAEFGRLAADNGAGSIWDRLRAGYVERTPSGGLHFIFRVDGKVLGNTPLARRPSTPAELAANPGQLTQVLLETRGEGGFVVVSPSALPNHGAWSATVGLPGQVVTITAAERDHLYDIARMLNQVADYSPATNERDTSPEASRKHDLNPLSPLDDFRARTDWAEILKPAGWSHTAHKDGRDYWLRPGKSLLDGGWDHSASTTAGHPEFADHLWVWSTSAGLPTETTLSKEFVWAHYHAAGDMRDAAGQLRELGFGDQRSADERRASKVVPGDVDPFSDGFDPDAWARQHAARSLTSPVPTLAPQPDPDDQERDTSPEADLRFQSLDWDALYDEDYVEEWIVDGFIGARRATALYSAPKLGKSLLMLELGVHASRGTPFIGMATRKTTVLYFDHENDPRGDIVPRLKSMGFTKEDLVNFKVLSYPDMATLDTAAGGRDMSQAVAQYDAGLVIIDTVSRTIEGEENSNDTWLAFYRNTGKWLKAAGIPYIRLDHSGKDESKGQRGGSAKSGDVDAIWQLIGDADDNFVLKLDGGRMQFPSDAIAFKRTTEPTASVQQDGKHAARSDSDTSATRRRIAEDIIAALLAQPNQTKNVLVTSVTGNAATKGKVLNKLHLDGWIVIGPNLSGTGHRCDLKQGWDGVLPYVWDRPGDPFAA